MRKVRVKKRKEEFRMVFSLGSSVSVRNYGWNTKSNTFTKNRKRCENEREKQNNVTVQLVLLIAILNFILLIVWSLMSVGIYERSLLGNISNVFKNTAYEHLGYT